MIMRKTLTIKTNCSKLPTAIDCTFECFILITKAFLALNFLCLNYFFYQPGICTKNRCWANKVDDVFIFITFRTVKKISCYTLLHCILVTNFLPYCFAIVILQYFYNIFCQTTSPLLLLIFYRHTKFLCCFFKNFLNVCQLVFEYDQCILLFNFYIISIRFSNNNTTIRTTIIITKICDIP